MFYYRKSLPGEQGLLDNISIFAVIPALILSGLLAVVLPTRWRHAVTRTLEIQASPEQVWDLLVSANGPGSWRPEVVEIRHDSDDPELLTQICSYREERLVVVMRVLEMVPCKQLIMRCEQIGDNRLPLGARAFSAIKLTPTDKGTRLAFREEGRFVSYLSFMLFALAQRASLRRLKNQAEGRDPYSAAKPVFGFSTLALVAGSIAAASAITALLGWQMGLLVFACLSVMEYGHALVLRYAGGRPSFATLLPFVGGALAMGQRQTSAYDEAVRALSGPAVLTILIMVLTMVASAVGNGMIADNIRFAAGIAAVIVALFLLPFYPLNGGWLFNTLRSNLPSRSFQVPALLVSAGLLLWSLTTGHVLAAGLAAGLIYELVVPLRSGIVADQTLSSYAALMIAGIYVSMNLIAYIALSVFLLS
jgi:hypothetical protein